jgi:hypothetical protein
VVVGASLYPIRAGVLPFAFSSGTKLQLKAHNVPPTRKRMGQVGN